MAGVNPIPLFDQRGSGFDRVASSSIDIGEFELQSLNLVVDTLDDESDGDYSDGDLSLREALKLANAFAGADTITFDGSLAGGEIDLSLGELTATDGLSLIGPGVDQLTIDAQGGSRVMRLSGTSTIDMSGLTLTGGTADQRGGLRVDANVTATLTDVSIQGNTATASGVAGEGVFNNGDLTLRDSSVTGNMATNASNALGDGLWNDNILAVEESTVADNSANFRGGGVFNAGGVLTITDSTISTNTAPNSGGGILSGNNGTVSITNSTLSGNSAQNGGGVRTLYGSNTTIRHSTMTGNSATGSGGGIFVYNGTVTLSHSLIFGNTAPTGSEIHRNYGTVNLGDFVTVHAIKRLAGLVRSDFAVWLRSMRAGMRRSCSAVSGKSRSPSTCARGSAALLLRACLA